MLETLARLNIECLGEVRGECGRSAMDEMNNCPGVLAETSTYPQRSAGSSNCEHLILFHLIFLLVRGSKALPIGLLVGIFEQFYT